MRFLPFLLGMALACGGHAMDRPAAPQRSTLARKVARWDAELEEVRDLVREAGERCEREAKAAGQAQGPARARAEAGLLKARAALQEREGELHLAVSDLNYDKFRLYRGRRRDQRGKALVGHCWEQAQRAAGRGILAFQEAGILAAQSELRQAVAEAMERAAELGARPGRPGRLAALKACEAALEPLERADEACVPDDFLAAQEADLQRILDLLSGTG